MANRVDFGDEPFDPPIGRIAGPVRVASVELIVKNHPPLIGQINHIETTQERMRVGVNLNAQTYVQSIFEVKGLAFGAVAASMIAAISR